MATRRMTRKQQQESEKLKYTCRDCSNSYDWHEKNWRGELFMCRCKHYTEGKYCKFLSDKQCANFNKRKDNGTDKWMG